jgi:hypothetical protein
VTEGVAWRHVLGGLVSRTRRSCVVAMRSGLADVRARCSFLRHRPEYMVGLEIANTEDLCLISVGACLNFRRCLGPQRLSALGVCELWQKLLGEPIR